LISTNVKLGPVTGDINNSTSSSLRTAKTLFSKVPKAVLTPLGTILYGNKETDDKKLKLEIYFTKSNN
jgi:hypothetical protein